MVSRRPSSPTRRIAEPVITALRRVFARTLRELLRTGRIVQTLWDAAQLQTQQREHYRRLGEIAVELVKQGKLHDIRIERHMAKIQRFERILKRQELLLRGYQKRGDLREVLRQDREDNADDLAPV